MTPKSINKTELHDYFDEVENFSTVFKFDGAISQDVIFELGDIINQFDQHEKYVQNAFSVFVELSQNIMYYAYQRENINNHEVGKGIIEMIESESSFYILTGNLIEINETESLKSRLDTINSMNSKELKLYYMNQRRKPRVPNKKGAGLGLIEAARKSNGKIKYHINKVNELCSFLILKVEIIKGV